MQKEIAVSELFYKIRLIPRYLLKNWKILTVMSLLGGITGLGYAIFKKPVYTASSIFVLDDNNKSDRLGELAGLTSMAGIELGGSSNNGIFTGDNIFELYKSRSMIEKTLLSQTVIEGKSQLLIDRYIDFNNLRSIWKKEDLIDTVTFDGKSNQFNRIQDSIISDFTILFNKKYLTISKPDKKMSIIKVSISSKDETFAKNFDVKLVETVNEFYTQTKTKRSNNSIKTIQYQLDSVKRVLNNSILGAAAATDNAPNTNPYQSILKVTTQRKQLDVQASAAIYTELVKNLEITKMTLRQETPLIQLIDGPVYPLPVYKIIKYQAALLGLIFSFFLTSFILICKKIYPKL